MDPSIVLKAFDLLYKVITGRNPRAKTTIQLSQGNWDSYFDVPSGDRNDYPRGNANSRVHFRLDFVMSHPETETIHEAKLFLAPRRKNSCAQIHATEEAGLYHSGGQELGEKIERFIENNPPFVPVQIEAKQSVRIIVPGYLDISPDTLHKTDDDVFVFLALRIGTKWLFSTIHMTLSGVGNSKIHRAVKWNKELSESALAKLTEESQDTPKSLGGTATSITPFKFY